METWLPHEFGRRERGTFFRGAGSSSNSAVGLYFCSVHLGIWSTCRRLLPQSRTSSGLYTENVRNIRVPSAFAPSRRISRCILHSATPSRLSVPFLLTRTMWCGTFSVHGPRLNFSSSCLMEPNLTEWKFFIVLNWLSLLYHLLLKSTLTIFSHSHVLTSLFDFMLYGILSTVLDFRLRFSLFFIVRVLRKV